MRLTYLALVGAPLAAALAAALVRPYLRGVGAAGALLSTLSLVAALRLAGQVLAGATPTWGPSEMMRVDALSALLAVCVAFVGALAAWPGPGLGRDERYTPAQARRFRIFSSLFAFTMLIAVTANNVAIMWVAVEATTITSALLIPLHASKASVEASWKYILIGSVGIALAFAGTVLAYFDFSTLVGRDTAALSWVLLREVAPALNPRVLELAFVFILIGYGTKAGVAPMHTWLPDAHSEAPSALSAMMSGVLLAVALYAIVRWQAVVGRAAVSPGFAENVIGLPPFGLFVSEFALVRAGFAAGRPLTIALVLALLAVGFVGVLAHLNRMLYGPPPGGVPIGERGCWALVPLGACLAALIVLGLTVPAALDGLLVSIAGIVTP